MNGQAAAEHPAARISIDPAKRSGQACIRGLRLTVKDVLEYLAGGMTEAEILEEFPELEREDFAAVYAWAAESLRRVAWVADKEIDWKERLIEQRSEVRLLIDENLPSIDQFSGFRYLGIRQSLRFRHSDERQRFRSSGP